MNKIDLTGLRADLPIGFMAALGCLRVCARTPRFAGSKLSWTRAGGSFHAVLWTGEGCTADDLVAMLFEDVKTAPERPELTWSDQIKTATPEQFAKSACELLRGAVPRDREPADWFAAFASDLAVSEGKIQTTPFDMSVARQRFLFDARKLAASLGNQGAAAAYREALFGPWRYEDDQHSLGWDPSTMKLGAYTYKAPTGMANTGVRAAVWLAFESVPLFPCFWDGGLRTRSFRRRGREVALCWPVWRVRLSVDAITTLLGWDALTLDDLPVAELTARCIEAVFISPRFKPNKYLASFRTAELVFGAAAAGAS